MNMTRTEANEIYDTINPEILTLWMGESVEHHTEALEGADKLLASPTVPLIPAMRDMVAKQRQQREAFILLAS